MTLELEDTIAEGNDFSEALMDNNEEVRFSIKLMLLIKAQIAEDDKFMHAKTDELSGMYSVSVRRAILEDMWGRAK